MNELNDVNPATPFLLYYCPGGTHSPHHPTPEWVKKISDMHLFDKGWNAVRDQIFDNQKKLGVIPQDAKLTPWPKDLLKEWDELTPVEQKLFIRQADVYGGSRLYTTRSAASSRSYHRTVTYRDLPCDSAVGYLASQRSSARTTKGGGDDLRPVYSAGADDDPLEGDFLPNPAAVSLTPIERAGTRFPLQETHFPLQYARSTGAKSGRPLRGGFVVPAVDRSAVAIVGRSRASPTTFFVEFET
jgi:hypothetical protein